MELSDEGQIDQITDKFKDLTQTAPEQKVSDTPLTIPQAVRPESNILRTEMALTELLSQRKALGVFTITPTNPVASTVAQISFSQDFIMSHLGDELGTASRFFTGWRCEYLKIEVEMTSMYQQQGSLIAFTTNFPSPYFNSAGRGNVLAHATRYPRKFMPFGNNALYTFELGWNSLLKYWPIYPKFQEGASRSLSGHNSYMDNGRITFRVFNPLLVATNVTDFVQLRIWISIHGLKLGVYSPVNNLL